MEIVKTKRDLINLIKALDEHLVIHKHYDGIKAFSDECHHVLNTNNIKNKSSDVTKWLKGKSVAVLDPLFELNFYYLRHYTRTQQFHAGLIFYNRLINIRPFNKEETQRFNNLCKENSINSSIYSNIRYKNGKPASISKAKAKLEKPKKSEVKDNYDLIMENLRDGEEIEKSKLLSMAGSDNLISVNVKITSKLKKLGLKLGKRKQGKNVYYRIKE